MEKLENPVLKAGMKTLREGIRNKYKAYHLLDRDRFPEFEYNTNRANYEPLRESFAEEFYVVRGLERNISTIHIPSTNTFTLIFCDDDYLPSRKILDTCRSYAEGRTKGIGDDLISAKTLPTAPASVILNKKRWAGLIILLTGLAIYVAINQLYAAPPASGLSIDRPSYGRTVPMEVIAAGRVTNASTVWVVIRVAGGLRYWVQPPIKVESDSTWHGVIYVGGNNQEHIGVRAQIRAFANPTKSLKAGEELFSWPEAEASSAIVDVVRGAARE